MIFTVVIYDNIFFLLWKWNEKNFISFSLSLSLSIHCACFHAIRMAEARWPAVKVYPVAVIRSRSDRAYFYPPTCQLVSRNAYVFFFHENICFVKKKKEKWETKMRKIYYWIYINYFKLINKEYTRKEERKKYFILNI